MRVALAAAVVLGIGCSGGTGPTTPPPPPPPPPPPNSIAVTSNQFNPPALTVNRNTTVTWNFNSGTHNVTFEDGQGNSSDQSSGSHSRNFGAAGTFRYRCTIHSTNFTAGMIGSVQVN